VGPERLELSCDQITVSTGYEPEPIWTQSILYDIDNFLYLNL